MRKYFGITLIALMAIATNAFAVGEARMIGKVVDADTKEPIKDAVISYESTAKKKISNSVKVKADGTYVVFILDGTLPYRFTVSAPGYEPATASGKLDLGINNIRNFELFKAGSAAPAGEPAADPAVEAYNEGVELANTGDAAGARAKFEQAVGIKADLLAGWNALAKINLKLKDYNKAVEAAQKVLEVDSEDPAMWAVLFESYTQLGDKAKAAEAEKKLPANAGALFNQAAGLINQGKDAEAEAMLKQAVEMDETFAVAWYELGMVYVRTGRNAEAKAALTKYLEIDPKGKDAGTAKDMLAYLK